ncbi:GntR family transcriptional regulator [Brevundimonas sp. LM2]|uniref:GntR family transcriptional regulator n=1 Tax=Brevundimonas sp. LM2 TaxID=1938605 RepID=UPI001558C8C2|nr:GntR family transcriptional regulator [Brevundimonas sp. LM2]
MGAVRQFAEAGRFVPGEALVITELAAEVGLSPTPVREALACLAGEGLIERRRGRGYFYPELTTADVIDLFELQLAFLHAALTLHPRGLGSLRKAVSGVDPLEGAQALFDAVVAQSANAALLSAHRRVARRLGPVLRAERTGEDTSGDTVRRMIDALIQGRLPDLLQELAAYHDQRCARVAALLTQAVR